LSEQVRDSRHEISIFIAMDSNIQRLMPRFRYGVINPRAPGKIQRGLSYQFYRIVPPDVMEITTGLGLDDYAPHAVEKAISNYWGCVHALMEEKVNVIVLGGVPISVRLGRPRLRELLAETKQETSIEVDAPLEALIAAMTHLGLRTIAIGSRWADDVNNAITRYLKDGGIEVAGITKRNQSAVDAAAMSFEDGLHTALDVGREAVHLAPAAEAVFVPGAAAMSLHAIPAVEAEFGKPTFTNLSVEVWNNMVRPGIIPPVQGWGRLLANNPGPE
jgi:arylmalonate decarboxylase